MTSAHIFFIPVVLIIGLIFGIVLGRRAALLQIQEEAQRQKRELERKSRPRPSGEALVSQAESAEPPRSPLS